GLARLVLKNHGSPRHRVSSRRAGRPKTWVYSFSTTEEDTPMDISALDMIAASVGPVAEMDRLGNEIAELSAHIEAAGAYLLELIREFDARGGWANGFHSCAQWLSWRVGMRRGTARERVRVARALGSLHLLAAAFARGELAS